MRNLLVFIRSHYFILLFLVLETLSLILFFNFNEFQNTKFYGITSTVSGGINSVFRNITEYFSLRETNKKLVEELADLHSRMPASFYQSYRLSGFRNDTLYKLQYRYISAKVISNSINKRNNFLMINKGSYQGIRNNMGVISGNRIIGQVVSVSPHFSWILSMLNKDSKISGKFKKNNQLVNVEWPGGDYRTGIIKEIPKHIMAEAGDTIITSGNSDLFPEGILIGVVREYTISQEENFNYGTIEFFTDFNNIGFVEVIVDMMRQEKENLRESFKRD